MQATIYVTEEALATANAIKDLDYYERMSLSEDEENDLSRRPGYYLKNANQLKIAVLSPNAVIARRLTPEDPVTYHRHVSMPTHLRGCLFEKAPNLPAGYAEIVTYWSGSPLNTNTSGAAYFQNPQNEYMVDMTPLDMAYVGEKAEEASVLIDSLLSEGVVVSIRGVSSLVSDLSPDHFIEVSVPVDDSMLGIEPDDFLSEKTYLPGPNEQYERIYLKVAHILAAPSRDRIYIDLIRHELIDYGYWY